MQQYGRPDEDEDSDHPVTRHLSPASRLSGPPVRHEEAPLPPARPVQPPRRIVPQAPEEQALEKEVEEDEGAGFDDEGHESLDHSHLFVRPPVHARGPVSQHPVGGGQRYESDEGEDGDEDGDGSENDAPALPVLQRKSVEVPPGRTLPPPPPPAVPPSHHHHLSAPPSDISDSDYDGQALPIRPRHTAVLPAAPTTLATPRHSMLSVPAPEESFLSYGVLSVAVSEPESAEVLDEEEGGKCLFPY